MRFRQREINYVRPEIKITSCIIDIKTTRQRYPHLCINFKDMTKLMRFYSLKTHYVLDGIAGALSQNVSNVYAMTNR